jgi:hypothetical protein
METDYKTKRTEEVVSFGILAAVIIGIFLFLLI